MHTFHTWRGRGAWLITSKGNVKFRILGQGKRTTNCLGKGLVPIWPRLDLKRVGAAIKIDVHHSRGGGTAWWSQGALPVGEGAVAKLTAGFSPGGWEDHGDRDGG